MKHNPHAPADRPNILVILTDDQRYDTINALGNRDIFTPNFDRLVQRGTSFQNAYIMGGSNPAVCMPSRAMLNTGRSIFSLERCGYQIPAAHTTIGEAFAQSGYHTIGIGKWHNGIPAYRRSFTDGAEILFAGMEDHWNVPLCHFQSDGNYPASKPSLTRLHMGREKEVVERSYDHIYDGRHSSEIFADAAVSMIDKYRDADAPFYMYLATMAPHDPRTMPQKYMDMYDPDQIPLPENYLPEHPFDKGDMKLRDEYLAPFPRTPDSVRRELASYYAMITHLDAQIGRVLDALDRTDQLDNTVIAFAGDNGLAIGSHGLMGKQSLYEHSIRVPLILSGPGIPVGAVYTRNALLNSVFPTLCDLAGIQTPSSVEFDSLVPALHGCAAGDDALFFAYTSYARAIKSGPYKLIEYLVDGVRRTQLFDLEADPWEMNNLASGSQLHAIIEDLRADLWEKQARYGDPMSGLFACYPSPAPSAGTTIPLPRMKAVVCRAIFDYVLDDIPVPRPEDGECLARVEGAAITQADCLAYAGSPRLWGNGDPAAFFIPPAVPLSDFVGRIDRDALGLPKGTRVVAEPVVPCGACRFCEADLPSLCRDQSTFGFMQGRDGGACAYAHFTARTRVHPIPPDMPVTTALLAPDVAQAMHCAKMAAPLGTDLIVLTCASPMGLAAVQQLRRTPCAGLIVLSEDEGCRAAARALGADAAIDPTRAAVVRDKRMLMLPGEFDILKYTKGYGCDVFINTVPHPQYAALGLELLCGTGRYLECAVFGGWTFIDWSLIAVQKELTVRGVKRGAGDYARAVDFLAKDDALARALRHTEYTLANWRDAFSMPQGALEKRRLTI